MREAVAAGFGIGVVFDSEFGGDPAMRRLGISDMDHCCRDILRRPPWSQIPGVDD